MSLNLSKSWTGGTKHSQRDNNHKCLPCRILVDSEVEVKVAIEKIPLSPHSRIGLFSSLEQTFVGPDLVHHKTTSVLLFADSNHHKIHLSAFMWEDGTSNC